MHRSRISVVLLDHPADQHDAAAAFWTGATGVHEHTPATDDHPYVTLSKDNDVVVALQRTGTGTAPRVHVDFETDDVAAEVARLRALGAAVVGEQDGYYIMTDPSGLVFCVVPIQAEAEVFERGVNTWP